MRVPNTRSDFLAKDKNCFLLAALTLDGLAKHADKSGQALDFDSFAECRLGSGGVALPQQIVAESGVNVWVLRALGDDLLYYADRFRTSALAFDRLGQHAAKTGRGLDSTRLPEGGLGASKVGFPQQIVAEPPIYMRILGVFANQVIEDANSLFTPTLLFQDIGERGPQTGRHWVEPKRSTQGLLRASEISSTDKKT